MGIASADLTTLLSELSHYATSRGARVAWGWGWPGEGAPGYWPWVQVLRSLGLNTPLSTAVGSPSGVDSTADAAPASARFQPER